MSGPARSTTESSSATASANTAATSWPRSAAISRRRVSVSASISSVRRTMFMGEVYHLAAVCRVADGSRHAPPPGLAFGEPDDRLQRGIQYAQYLRLLATLPEYYIIRLRG